MVSTKTFKKNLSVDERNTWARLEDLTKHPWWVYLRKQVQDRIDTIDKILKWEQPYEHPQTHTYVNIDTIGYSMASILRNELSSLKSIIDLPEKTIKSLWYYSEEPSK